MKVIVAGGRNIKDYELVAQAIKDSGFTVTKVISGKAKYGADRHGEDWANANGVELETFPADWDNITHPDAVVRYNKWGKPYDAVAGHRRNEEMAKVSDALVLIWDGSSSGSADMLKRAKAHGLLVHQCVIDVDSYNEAKRARLQAQTVLWATKIRENKEAVVIDTESCGGNKNDEIISIGIVRLHNGEVLFQSLLKPSDDVHFNWYATQVHGITQEALSKAPTLPEVWDTIYDLLHNKDVLAYNFSSDERMIGQTVRKYGLDMPEINWYCIMKEYKKYTLRTANTNLTNACAEMNVKSGGHDAVNDALAAARLVYRMEQEYQPIETTQSVQTGTKSTRRNPTKA